VQARADGPNGAAQRGGGLFVTLAFEIAQHNRLAVTNGQQRDGLAERLGVNGEGDGDGDLSGGIASFEPGCLGGVDWQPAALAALPALHELARYACEKRGQRAALRVEVGRVMDQPDEDVLSDLGGLDRVGGHVKGETEYGGVMSAVECGEGVAIASPEAADEGTVVDRVRRYRRGERDRFQNVCDPGPRHIVYDDIAAGTVWSSRIFGPGSAIVDKIPLRIQVPKRTPSPVERLPVTAELVERKIRLIRGQKVMLDGDLADLYQVPTKVLNQAVRRNLDRFREDFMFRLTEAEASSLRSQFVTSNPGRGGRRYLPYAFTEHGVAMLSSVLSSKRAVQMNIVIIRSFVKLREILASNRELARRLDQVEYSLKRHGSVIGVVSRRDQKAEAAACHNQTPHRLPDRRQIGAAGWAYRASPIQWRQRQLATVAQGGIPPRIGCHPASRQRDPPTFRVAQECLGLIKAALSPATARNRDLFRIPLAGLL
jgi:hypothetical protein